jgi:uncharacterized membrane protein
MNKTLSQALAAFIIFTVFVFYGAAGYAIETKEDPFTIGISFFLGTLGSVLVYCLGAESTKN